jgi:hypothetical protein
MTTTTKGVTLTHRTLILSLVALAVLVMGGAARASSFEELAALGYSTHRTTGVAACVQWNSVGASDSASGYGASADFGCVNGPDYDAAIDSFVAGHLDRKLAYEHPTAAAARDDITAKGYAVTVDYDAATFTVSGGCDINATVAADNLATYAATLPTAAGTVGIYVRVSRKGDREDERFHSPREQAERAAALAVAKGYVPGPVFEDIDVSGATAPADRPAMGELLEARRGGRARRASRPTPSTA